MFKLGNVFDSLIDVLNEDTITTVYGPPGVGKSTLCFQYVISCLKESKKVIYVDTEGGFSTERLLQMDPNVNLNDVIVLSPRSFEDQKRAIFSLNREIKNNKTIGLVIVDSLVMLYRLKLGDAPQKVNSELGEQLRLLTEISRNFKIPILVTNQMYTSFDTREKKMVGGTVIEYWSKTIVEIDKDGDYRKAILKKHKYKKEGEEILFDINSLGFEEIKNRGFNFFK